MAEGEDCSLPPLPPPPRGVLLLPSSSPDSVATARSRRAAFFRAGKAAKAPHSRVGPATLTILLVVCGCSHPRDLTCECAVSVRSSFAPSVAGDGGNWGARCARRAAADRHGPPGLLPAQVRPLQRPLRGLWRQPDPPNWAYILGCGGVDVPYTPASLPTVRCMAASPLQPRLPWRQQQWQGEAVASHGCNGSHSRPEAQQGKGRTGAGAAGSAGGGSSRAAPPAQYAAPMSLPISSIALPQRLPHTISLPERPASRAPPR